MSLECRIEGIELNRPKHSMSNDTSGNPTLDAKDSDVIFTQTEMQKRDSLLECILPSAIHELSERVFCSNAAIIRFDILPSLKTPKRCTNVATGSGIMQQLSNSDLRTLQ